jgi:hypothetical protein
MIDNWAASAEHPQTAGFSASRATPGPQRLDTGGFQNTNTAGGGVSLGPTDAYMQPWKPKPGIEAQTPVNRAHMAAFAARPAHQWGSSYAPRTPMRPPTAAELAAGKAWAPQLADFVIPGLNSMSAPAMNASQMYGAYTTPGPMAQTTTPSLAGPSPRPGYAPPSGLTGKSYIPPAQTQRGGFLASMSPYGQAMPMTIAPQYGDPNGYPVAPRLADPSRRY